MNLKYLYINNQGRFKRLAKKLIKSKKKEEKPTKEGVLSKLLENEKGRTKLGEAMAVPICQYLSRDGLFRRAVDIEPLPLGAFQYLNRNES